jgi:hypothetical protein
MKRSSTPKSLASMLLAEASTVGASGSSLHVPLYVLLGEAIDVARFCQHYWHPEIDRRTHAVVRPGLELAGEALLPKTIADEILTLHDLVQEAQTAYLLTNTPKGEGIERAEHVLAELSAAIEWVCSDGTRGDKSAKLTAIVEAHRNDDESEDALASRLADYVGLAAELKEELETIGAFEAALIEEGRRLVLTLRERSAVRARGRNGKTAALLARRNQLAAILSQRIARVRAAARYVFRHHAEIAKQVTSAYERRRRSAARRKSSGAPPSTPPRLPSTVVKTD